jgi:hypothetical protein
MEYGSSFTNSLAWLQGTLLGSAATIIAILAVAMFGLMMLWGHIDRWRGVRIVIGCFILFGAPAIAAGLLTAAGSGDAGSGQVQMAEPIAPPAPLPYQPPRQGGSVCWTCGESTPQGAR